MSMIRIVQREIDEATPLLTGIHPLLARVYRTRAIRDHKQLNYSLQALDTWKTMMNIEHAASLIYAAMEQQKQIVIIADFDADGATSCVLLLRCLKAMGCKNIDYLVPNRFEYGYGLTPEIVELAKTKKPDLIITVDNGISSISGVRFARKAGIDVLITDHHLAGKELPDANVILNPNQPGDLFPSKNLAGVGVVFYLMIALRHLLQQQEWYQRKKIKVTHLATYLDLVALGTIADVVSLDHNNRILVSQGLARIRSGRCCAGIQALLEIAGKEKQYLVASDIGFAIAPRINAAGRLTDMSLGIECLLTDSDEHARFLANELEQLNRERKSLQQDMQLEAQTLLDACSFANSEDWPAAISLFQENWHPGIVGILASKIKEQLHRPVIVFAPETDSSVKGSARSVTGINIRDVLEYIQTQSPGLIKKFGGHAMAAGLTLEKNRLNEFQEVFAKTVVLFQATDHEAATIYSDGKLQSSDLTLTTAEVLRQAGPWGQGFSEPVFDGQFELLGRKILADKHLKMQLRLDQKNHIIDAIAFYTTDEHWPHEVTFVYLAYRISVNYFMGRKRLQLLVQYIEPASE